MWACRCASSAGGQHWRRNGTPTFRDRKSTRLNSSHTVISYAVFCLKKKKRKHAPNISREQTYELRKRRQLDRALLGDRTPLQGTKVIRKVAHVWYVGGQQI